MSSSALAPVEATEHPAEVDSCAVYRVVADGDRQYALLNTIAQEVQQLPHDDGEEPSLALHDGRVCVASPVTDPTVAADLMELALVQSEAGT